MARFIQFSTRYRDLYSDRRMKHIKFYNIIDSYLHRFMKQKHYNDYYKGGTMFLNIIYTILIGCCWF
jgi:hypothetical protein